MPVGRVPVRGGVASGRLSWDIGIGSLRRYRSDKAPDLTCRDARNAHKQIRIAVNLYRLAHGGSKGTGPLTRAQISAAAKSEKPLTKTQIAKAAKRVKPLTRTQIVEAVNTVKKNAAGVVRSGCKVNWLERLADALTVNVNLLADLGFAMRRQKIDIWNLRSKLDCALSDGGNFSEADLVAVKVLSEIEVDEVVPPHSHPDPPLTNLVLQLTPTWRLVTGTSPYPKTIHVDSDDRRYGDKWCPFADWVDQLIIDAGLRSPPSSSVARLVRLQKSRK